MTRRHDARNDRWAPRLQMLEPVLAVALPAAMLAIGGADALVGFLLLAAPLYIWAGASWCRRRVSQE